MTLLYSDIIYVAHTLKCGTIVIILDINRLMCSVSKHQTTKKVKQSTRKLAFPPVNCHSIIIYLYEIINTRVW